MIRVENTSDRDISLPHGMTVTAGRAIGVDTMKWASMRDDVMVSAMLRMGFLVASETGMETPPEFRPAMPVSMSEDRIANATKDQLKAELDALGVQYESKATADDLRDLARKTLAA